MKPVFKFIDYRKFLANYYNEQKKNKRNFSHRYFAEKAGISSSSFLTRVINGKRNLTAKMIEKFSAAMKMNHKETLYFRHLVQFNQATTARDKQEHYMVLRSMSGAASEKILQSSQYDFFEKWYNAIVREIICLGNFQDDYEAIARHIQPAITPGQVKKSVSLLLKLELVEKKLDGSYRQLDKVLAVDDTVFSMAVRSFADSMLDHAREAMHRVKLEERHVSSMTLGISPACYDLLSAEIEAFRDRVKSIVSRDKDSSRVYQFNLQFFPMTGEISPLKQGEQKS